MRTPITGKEQYDWASHVGSYGLAWGLPIAAMIAGAFLGTAARTAIWTAALLWMGAACLLNARRCGRTHCRYTGPFFLLMIVPVLAMGAGLVPAGPNAWLVLAAVVLVGSKLIWWVSERVGGKFT